MAKKNNFYVVWNGVKPGIYDSWEECLKQVHRFPAAKFKGFEKREEAEAAFTRGYENYISSGKTQKVSDLLDLCVAAVKPVDPPIQEAIAVDAACSGNPGKVEYQGVYVRGKNQLFHVGPLEQGTNNIGEFLAIVHGLGYLKKMNSPLPLYSDSANAISWVKQKKCKTKLAQTDKNAYLFELIARAERWLATNTYTTQILKWNTEVWGEIPADFGRK